MPPEMIWPRGAHTEGKHLVLRKYLSAWLPILGSWNRRIVFVDGFAGPGVYAGGEDGSPVIAMKALIDHAFRRVIRSEVRFIFIDADEARVANLREVVEGFRGDLPEKASVSVVHGEFDASMNEVLDSLEEQRKQLAPTLVMIDPFGVSGMPMEVIGRILSNPQCEVYVSFMYESMNRFLTTPEFEEHLDALFGTDSWRHAIALTGEERKRFLYTLYAEQLRTAGAKYVVHFDLYDGNRLIYAIFFGTAHSKGCDMMKRAVWKVDPTGGKRFKGSRQGQLLLGIDQVDTAPLQDALCEAYGDREWVDIREIQEFVASDAVDYHTGHLKTLTLQPMEQDGRIKVDEDSRRHRLKYPAGTRVWFEC